MTTPTQQQLLTEIRNFLNTVHSDEASQLASSINGEFPEINADPPEAPKADPDQMSAFGAGTIGGGMSEKPAESSISEETKSALKTQLACEAATLLSQSTEEKSSD